MVFISAFLFLKGGLKCWFGLVFFYKYLSTKHRCLKIAVFSFMETTSHQGMSCVYMEYKVFSGNFKTELFYLLYLFIYLFLNRVRVYSLHTHGKAGGLKRK